MSIRVVVVDARPMVRWALHQLAIEQPDMAAVGETDSAAGAAHLVATVEPTVVCVDVSLDGDTGWELAADLRATYPTLGLVLLAPHPNDDLLLRALDLEVSAFVTHRAPVAELVSAIRHAASAPTSFTSTGLGAALRRRVTAASQTQLSARERQVLGLLQAGHSVPEIARRLFVSLSTAKTYVTRLYDKLGACNRAQALMTAVRLGLVSATDPVDIDAAPRRAFAAVAVDTAPPTIARLSTREPATLRAAVPPAG